MKIVKSLLLAAACSAVVTSCQREADNGPEEQQAVRFTSGIATRASGERWDAGDRIGIWMVADGGTAAVDGVENTAYVTTSGDGNFEPVNPSETIYFPQNGDAVNFIAYYPWKSAAGGGSYAIDLSDQTRPEDIDLLNVHDTRQFSRSNPTADLTFRHRLSRIELETVAGDGLTQAHLGGMTLTIDGMDTRAAFDILADNITDPSTPAGITMRAATDGADYNAIVLPGTIADGAVTVEFGVVNVGTFHWTIPAIGFEPGKTYKWKVTVKRSGVSVGGVEIEDWEVDNKGEAEATQIVVSEAGLHCALAPLCERINSH